MSKGSCSLTQFQGLRENSGDAIRLSASSQLDALPKRKTHAGIDDKVLPAKEDAKYAVLFVAKSPGIVEIGAIIANDSRFKIERLDSANVSEGTFGVRPSLGKDSHALGLYLHEKASYHADDNDNSRNDADDDQRKLPMGDECKNEGGHEGGNGLEEDTQLVGNTQLNRFSVRSRLHGDGAGGSLVEEANFLAQSRPNVHLPNVAGQPEGDIGECGCVDVVQDEAGDANVNEV